jgi:hypothetical protein
VWTLKRTDVSEERIASIIGVTRISELGTLAVISNRAFRLLVIAIVVPSAPIFVTLIMEAIISSETSVLTRATRHHFQEDIIFHSHRREKPKSYITLTGWAK